MLSALAGAIRFVMVAIMTVATFLTPFLGKKEGKIERKSEDCKAAFAAISDTHLTDSFIRLGMFEFGLQDMAEATDRLDALVITHPDLDHFGGASSILRTFPVKELWINECSRTEAKADWQKTIATAADREISIRDIGRGFTWREHRFEIQAVHPNPNSTAGLKCNDANQGSITLRAHGLGHSAMLTGDLTAAGEKEILASDTNIRSDILKLGHHGSKTSSSAPFLDAVAPQLALISSGRKNRFRHPSKQVIERLDSLHIPYLNTATSGTVFVTFSADTVIVEPMLK
ncbi:MAG: MBL fold metallo-hydrolase [Clostridia bacterium]|nr:MBL fold metallo-hydrolase [Clostridia bacterium]